MAEGRLVLEGAGSPVEVNLHQRDLTNLRLAQYLRANCLLVADIERGGVFAQIVGTLALLRPVERPLIKGILINRFRGRRELFDQGRTWLEQHTGVPVLGGDALAQRSVSAGGFPRSAGTQTRPRPQRSGDRGAEAAVDQQLLRSGPAGDEASVRLRWVSPGDPLGQPDAVLLPGSKQTLRISRLCAAVDWTGNCWTSPVVVAQCWPSAAACSCSGRTCMIPTTWREATGRASAWLGLLPLTTQFGGTKRCGSGRCRRSGLKQLRSRASNCTTAAPSLRCSAAALP